MGWKTIVVENAERVSLYLDNIVIKKQDTPHLFLISDLNCIIFEDPKSVITTRIINELAKNNVLVIFCNQNYMPTSFVQPYIGHHLQFKIMNTQIKWSIEKKRSLWTKIIQQKIENQVDILKLNEKSPLKIQKMLDFIGQVEMGDVTNREGHAAKVYFNELFGMKFVRTDNESIINSGLDYGYSIMRSAMSRAIVSKGLHPSISLFHSNQFDPFALADDLMEPFRPLVDDFVYNNYHDWTYFGKDEKLSLINLLNSQIMFDGKIMFVTNAMSQFVDNVMDFMGDPLVEDIVFPYVERIQYYDEL